MEDRFLDVLSSDPFPKKRSDHESQKSGCRFDLKNPLEVWILWIHDPFLDFSNKTKNPFSDSRIRFLDSKLLERMAGNLSCFLPSSVLPQGGGGGGTS